ncbi:ATP-grasp domain-containing protein [Streptomyces sp. Tue 6430]|nr:ATP-grasp domain-containing protein [Streptomyces sp. Tue 6430]
MSVSRTLLLIASSANPELLRTPRDLGLDIVLSTRTPPADASLYDIHLDVDEFDEEAVLSAVRAHLADGGRVDAVATFHEGALHVAARVAAELGLPGNSVEAVRAMRDKFVTGRRLEEAGVPTPATRIVTTYDQALATAEELGYPLVLKPQASGASQGVTKVVDEEQLRAAFENIAGIYDLDSFDEGDYTVPNVARVYAYPDAKGVLVQEYVGARSSPSTSCTAAASTARWASTTSRTPSRSRTSSRAPTPPRRCCPRRTRRPW